jgi:hypothetical protein
VTSAQADAAAPPATTRGFEPLATIGVGLAVAALALARQSGLAAWRTIWAEDGGVLLADVWRHGWHSVQRPYAGYLQLSSRLLTLPVGALPVRTAAIYFAVVSAAGLGLVATGVWRISRNRLRQRVARLTLVLAFALLPAMIGENLDNITNLIWALLFAMFWACACRSEDRLDTGIRAGILGLGAASTVLAALYLPGVAWMVWRRRRGDLTGAVAYGIGGVLQAAVALGATHDPAGRRGDVAEIARSIGTRVAGSSVAGERWLPALSRNLGSALPWSATLVLLGAIALAWVAGRPSGRRLAVFALVGALIAVLAALLFRGIDAVPAGEPLVLGGSRYTVVPLLLVVSAFVILLDGAWSRPGWPKVVTIGFMVWAVVLVGVNFRNANGRTDGPDWRSGVATAQAKCRADPARTTAKVTVSPTFIVVTVPCSRLR